MAHNSSSDGNGFKHDVQSLRGGVDTLTSDVSNLAHSTADAARSGASELRQRAQDAVETTKAKLDSAKNAAADATQSLKTVISDNPLASVGIAAGVGILIGLVFLRPRS